MDDAPIQIGNEQVVREVRELAALTGVSEIDAVAEAVRLELARAKRSLSIEERLRAVEEAVREFNEAPIVGPMLTDDDFYDEDGFPR
jgi:hypothetical protein